MGDCLTTNVVLAWTCVHGVMCRHHPSTNSLMHVYMYFVMLTVHILHNYTHVHVYMFPTLRQQWIH